MNQGHHMVSQGQQPRVASRAGVQYTTVCIVYGECRAEAFSKSINQQLAPKFVSRPKHSCVSRLSPRSPFSCTAVMMVRHDDVRTTIDILYFIDLMYTHFLPLTVHARPTHDAVKHPHTFMSRSWSQPHSVRLRALIDWGPIQPLG